MNEFERVTPEGAEIDAYRLEVPSGWIYLTPKGPIFVPHPPGADGNSVSGNRKAE